MYESIYRNVTTAHNLMTKQAFEIKTNRAYVPLKLFMKKEFKKLIRLKFNLYCKEKKAFFFLAFL